MPAIGRSLCLRPLVRLPCHCCGVAVVVFICFLVLACVASAQAPSVVSSACILCPGSQILTRLKLLGFFGRVASGNFACGTLCKFQAT
eukprot:12615870-Alexandrium_andersonii.AAC.1